MRMSGGILVAVFGILFALTGRAWAAGAAPEIAPTSAVAGLMLVVGSIFLYLERRPRR
jgi:hypothetical protein